MIKKFMKDESVKLSDTFFITEAFCPISLMGNFSAADKKEKKNVFRLTINKDPC